MIREERKLALYCLKANSDYHSEVCEECVNYPNCDHTIQDDVTEIIIKALEQEPCDDCISRERAKQFLYERIDRLNDDELYDIFSRIIDDMYNELPPVTPQGPCNDAISRQAVLNIDFNRIIHATTLPSENIKRAINDLPPISVAEKTPMLEKSNFDEKQYRFDLVCAYECGRNSVAEKTGRWEWNQYDYNPNLGNWHCSECGSIAIECVPKKDPSGVPLYKYCPQCGCRLVGPQESEDNE